MHISQMPRQYGAQRRDCHSELARQRSDISCRSSVLAITVHHALS
jgi:hypothetical protein